MLSRHFISFSVHAVPLRPLRLLLVALGPRRLIADDIKSSTIDVILINLFCRGYIWGFWELQLGLCRLS